MAGTENRPRGHVTLTRLDLDTLRGIVRLTRERGFPPSLKELALAVGTPNWNVLTRPLAKLRRLGLVGAAGGPRSLVVTCRWLPAATEGGVTP
jgi:SOS-response transcriptional repressor LexA